MADIEGHTLVYLSHQERRSVASAKGDESMYHGSVFRSRPAESGAEAQGAASKFTQSIERGIRTLYEGSSRFCADVIPRAGAAVEVLDYYDVSSGEHVLVWRIECVGRKAGA